ANVIVNALQELGVDKIDYMILSHSHWDHIGGAPYIMDVYPVDNIYVNGEGYPYETYARLAQYFTADGNNVEVVAFGDKLSIGSDIAISIYNPAVALNEINEDDRIVNNNSLVARVEWQDRAILLTSDIYTEALERLVNADIDLSADILALPHHGNDGFGEIEVHFLEEVNPQVAIKSSDWGELQTQTSGELTAFLEAAGIEFMATARDGEITSNLLEDQLVVGSDTLIWRQ
ncbi:ComEC/Rec2 family competence protein, partial [Patescibacteria group bacterium]